MDRVSVRGRVVTGQGQGASFTQVDRARSQFVELLGIDPYPGTLNLSLDETAGLAAWSALQSQPGDVVVPADSAWCRARCYPVTVRAAVPDRNPNSIRPNSPDAFPAAIVFPEVPGYPTQQVEVIAALPLRATLGVQDGDWLEVTPCGPQPARAVIFDVDGTLIDSLEAYRVVAELAAAPYGLAVTAAAVAHALNTGASFWEAVLPDDTPDREGLIRALKDEAGRRWPEVLRAHGRLAPGLPELLESLRGQGARLGIVTGSRAAVLEPLAGAGLLPYFASVITGQDVARRKPDPEGLLKCAQALGVEPSEAVYVGDTPLDVQASRAAGMGALAVLSGAGDSASLSAAGPDRVLSSLARLPAVLDLTS